MSKYFFFKYSFLGKFKRNDSFVCSFKYSKGLNISLQLKQLPPIQERLDMVGWWYIHKSEFVFEFEKHKILFDFGKKPKSPNYSQMTKASSN